MLLGRPEGAPAEEGGDDEDEDEDEEPGLFGDEEANGDSETCGNDEAESETEYEEMSEWRIAEESYTGDKDETETYAHGYGILTRRLQETQTGHEKVTRYSGKFKEGVQSGHGEERCDATGELWRGEWCQGLQHGLGEWHYTSGSVFRGTFEGGKPEGAGTYLPAGSDKDLPGIYTCEEAVLHKMRAGESGWPAHFEKRLDVALQKAHEATARALVAAEAAEEAAQLRERIERRLAEERSSQGPLERKEARELRIALAVGIESTDLTDDVIATYATDLTGDDAESRKRLKEAENRALFVAALAHGRTKSLIKEHERLTEGDYSKTS